MKAKLLYILPEYDEKAATHHVHLFELLEELGKKMDIFLIVEKSTGRPQIENLKKIATPKNILARFSLIIFARILGYRKAYVHYSYWGAIFASLFMTTYYWHCEVYDRFFSDFKLSIASIKKKFLDEYLMVLTLNMVDYLVTGTKTVGNFYQKQFNLSEEKIKIVPNWINIDRFKRQLVHDKKKKIVLFAHKLVKRKGADYLPEIIKKVSKEIKNVLFLIAGPEGDTAIDFKSRVKQLGAVPNKEIPDLMARSDLFIMPSRQEGFPRVLIEAMAVGLPFVAMDVGGTGDVVNEFQGKYLVKPGDIETFSENIIYLLKHPRELKKLSISGRKRAEKYDIKVVSRLFYNLLAS